MYDFKTSRVSKAKAFTLVEILAAISLFAVMTVAIASVLGETNSLTNRLKSRQASVSSAHISLERIQKDLYAAFDEKIQRSPSFFKSEEVNGAQQITFSYLESPIMSLFMPRTSGLRVVRYYTENEQDGHRSLFRKEIPYHQIEDLDLLDGEKIATGIVRMEFQFYDPRNDQWIEDWDDKGPYTGGYFPEAIKILIQAVDPSLPPELQLPRSLTYQTSLMLLNEISEAQQ